MIRVLFFARLREQLECERLELDWSARLTSIAALRHYLGERGESWQQALEADNIVCALNHQQVEASHPLQDGDEVAFFPPVTGG